MLIVTIIKKEERDHEFEWELWGYMEELEKWKGKEDVIWLYHGPQKIKNITNAFILKEYILSSCFIAQGNK